MGKKKNKQNAKGMKKSKVQNKNPNSNNNNGMDIEGGNNGNKSVTKKNAKRKKNKNPQLVGKPKELVPKGQRIQTEAKADHMKRCQEITKAHHDSVTGCIMDGTKVYSAGRDGKLKTWVPGMSELTRAPELKLESEIDLGKPINCLLLANDCLFSGLQDGSIVAFSKADGQKVEWKAHEQKVTAMIMEQGVLITGSGDSHLQCWQFQNGSFQSVAKIKMQAVISKLMCINGILFIGTFKGLFAAQLATLHTGEQPPKMLPKSQSGVNGLTRYQTFAICCCRDGSIQVYDGATGENKHSVAAMPDAKVIRSCTILESENRLICGHVEGRVTSFQLPSMERKAKWCVFSRHGVELSVPAGFDGVYFLGAQDGTIQLWQHKDHGKTGSSIIDDNDL